MSGLDDLDDLPYFESRMIRFMAPEVLRNAGIFEIKEECVDDKWKLYPYQRQMLTVLSKLSSFEKILGCAKGK